MVSIFCPHRHSTQPAWQRQAGLDPQTQRAALAAMAAEDEGWVQQNQPSAARQAEQEAGLNEMDRQSEAFVKARGAGQSSTRTQTEVLAGERGLVDVAKRLYGEQWRAGLALLIQENKLKANQWGSPLIREGQALQAPELNVSEETLAKLDRLGGQVIANNSKGLAARAELQRMQAEQQRLQAERAAEAPWTGGAGGGRGFVHPSADVNPYAGRKLTLPELENVLTGDINDYPMAARALGRVTGAVKATVDGTSELIKLGGSATVTLGVGFIKAAQRVSGSSLGFDDQHEAIQEHTVKVGAAMSAAINFGKRVVTEPIALMTDGFEAAAQRLSQADQLRAQGQHYEAGMGEGALMADGAGVATGVAGLAKAAAKAGANGVTKLGVPDLDVKADLLSALRNSDTAAPSTLVRTPTPEVSSPALAATAGELNAPVARAAAVERPAGLTLSDEVIQDIRNMPHGSRPDPKTYTAPEAIAEHLGHFDEGASYLVPKSALDRYGRDTLGWPDNSQFVMPAREMDQLLTKAGGDVAAVEKALGIPPGQWADQALARIDVPKPRDLNLRMPSGNEMGANQHWLPGGRLPTGYREAVINQIPKAAYVERGVMGRSGSSGLEGSNTERMTGGLRNPANLLLEDGQISHLKREFLEIGGDPSILRFNKGAHTSYVDQRDIINIRGDILPIEGATHPRSSMSTRAVLAHELGHRAHRGTGVQPGAWNDEFRASYWAAKNTPNLTEMERVDLLNDAILRAREGGVPIKLNQFMRRTLYGY